MPTLFVIDDDPQAGLAAARIAQAAGAHVQTCQSAEQFLALVDADITGELRVGGIILDIGLPGMSGLDLMELLIQRGCPPPIIVVTGGGSVEMEQRAASLGALAYLEKPYLADRLFQFIVQLNAPPPSAADASR